jgi:hypothetical protein
MSGFTPGPWAWCEISPDDREWGACEVWQDCEADVPVATMVIGTDNARLIAAAPDLLEALQGCLPRNVCLTNANIPDDTILPMDVTMGSLRKISAAIAKATLNASRDNGENT